jgi:hypothetical protein
MENDSLRQKVYDFITNNQFEKLKKYPTEKLRKELQKVMNNCNSLIDKPNVKDLLQIKPTAPSLNARIKIHKEQNPIQLFINSILTYVQDS